MQGGENRLAREATMVEPKDQSSMSFSDIKEALSTTQCCGRKIDLLKLATANLQESSGRKAFSGMPASDVSLLLDQIIDIAIPVQFPDCEQFNFEEKDFDRLSDKTEGVLKFVNVFVDVCIENGEREKKWVGRCLPKLLVVITSNMRKNLWSTEVIQSYCLLVLDRLRHMYKVDSFSDLLLMDVKTGERDTTTPTKNVCGRYLQFIIQKLTRDNWYKNPTFIESFYWMLTQMIKFPHLSAYLDFVLPPALNFVDSHLVHYRVLGIQCLHHIITNVSQDELRWYGRASVVFDALKHQIYSREPDIIHCLHPALLAILPVVDKDPAKPSEPTHARQADILLSILIINARAENGIVLRRLFTQCIADFIDIMEVSAVRHLGTLVSLISEYLEVFDGPEERSRLNALRILRSLLKNVWPRIFHHTDTILTSLLKLLQDVECDKTTTPCSVKKKLKEDAIACLLLLRELCPDVQLCLQAVCQEKELSYIACIVSDFM